MSTGKVLYMPVWYYGERLAIIAVSLGAAANCTNADGRNKGSESQNAGWRYNPTGVESAECWQS